MFRCIGDRFRRFFEGMLNLLTNRHHLSSSVVPDTLTTPRVNDRNASNCMKVHRNGVPGPRVQMTARWKALVELALRERGWGRADLARELGVSRAAITKLLDQQDVSALVPAICKVLDIPPPMVEAGDDAEAAIVARVASWTDDQRARMLELLEVIEKMIS